MGPGRPRKYTKKTLREGVDAYFRSISRTVQVKDDLGNVVRNDDGNVIERIQYVLPPSIGAMCVYLGIDTSTWDNYSDQKKHPELQEVTSMTKTRMRAYLEEQSMIRDKGLQGILFNLQNNYGWKNKTEVDLGKDTREAAAESLSMAEKLALIRQVKESLEE